MVLRNVPSTATFEEQRVEINELAVDVDTLASNPDTLQTVTDRGFTTDNPIKIENYAATAFVIEDGSSNEKFVVDSVNGKINVGSSAGGASGIYLFHNNSGATPAITLDGATGSITNKGQLVTESILSSAALNNKGSVQFGTVDAYSIGHMPLNSNLAFSQTHGGSYLFYSDASTVELEIASGGITVDGTGSFASGALSISNVGVTTVDIAGGNSGWAFYASNNDSRTGRPTYKATNKAGGELFGGTNADASANVFAIQSDGSATFASGGASISSSGTGSFNLLSIMNVSGSIGGSGGVENWIGFKHGSTFGLNLKTAGANTGYVGINTTTPASRLDVNHPSAPGIRVGGNGGGGDYHLEMGQINTNGSPGINATGTSTSLKFQLNGTEVARFNASGEFINVAGAEFGSNIKSDGQIRSDRFKCGNNADQDKILLNNDGSASFTETVSIGSGSAAPDDYGLIAYANANTLSNKSAVYARNLADGRNFTGDNSSGATTFEVYASGAVNASDTITAPFIRGDGADGTSADTALFRNLTSGGDNRVRINTYANGGGDPYIKFDAGGSNFIVGEEYNGTTNNKLVLGVGETPAGVTGIYVNGLGQTVIGSYAMNSEQLRVKGAEADIWLDSQTSGVWRILGSTGGSTHQFRVYDNTNSADRLTISSVGRIRLPAVPGVAGSNLANLQIEADGNLCTTTSIRAAKTNISPLADTSWLFDLNPVTFNWRTKTENEDGTLSWGEDADGGTQYGLIAEEVKEVNDDFCYYYDGELTGVHYDRLVAPLLKVVQQQKEQIEALEARLDAAGL